mmetsp:Transcript_23490/g.75232  ORF Transcript_23490/g.75232 Transcript_23490/m.75232 type:complete len:153 (-) Transcript_23490:6-464(-)
MPAKRRGRWKKRLRRSEPTAATGCEPLNRSRTRDSISELPGHFLRHWPHRSVSARHMQETYDSLVSWGRTRFQVVGGALYYPDLKHNTFGCVLRRSPILAWALLETLERHPVADVDIPVNCRDKPGTPLSQRLRGRAGPGPPPPPPPYPPPP